MLINASSCVKKRRVLSKTVNRPMCYNQIALKTMLTMMCQLVLFCVVSSALCSPAPETNHEKERVRKEDDVSLDGLQRVVQQQASTINRLEAKLTATENQLNSMGSQVQAIGTLQAELAATKSQVNAQQTLIDSLGSQQQTTQHQVEDLSKSVAFTARISGQHDNNGRGMTLGYQQTVVFDQVVTNVGNAYDPTTGIFTAPVNGLYVFNLCAMGPVRNHDVSLAIVKNGVVLDKVYAEGDQSAVDQGCSQVTTTLAEGNHVWVRQDYGNLVRADWWTIFTGFLLHAE